MSISHEFPSTDRAPIEQPAPGMQATDKPPPPRIPRMLTIEEACFLSQESREALLRKGELGSLTFFVRVPAGAKVRLYNERNCQRGDPPLMQIPQILCLDKEACTQMLTWGRAQIGQVTLGASLSMSARGDHFRVLRPEDAEAPAGEVRDVRHFPLARWTHWKVEGQAGAQVEVEASSLRVFQSDIEELFDLRVKPRRELSATAGSGEQENYKSSLLQFANQAAWLFWGRTVDKDETSTWPAVEDIVRWLRTRDETVSESLAKSIAAAIRPDFAPRARVSKELKDVRDPPKKRRNPSSR